MNALLPSVLLRGSESAPSIRAIADRLDALCGASVGSLVRKKGEIQLTGLFADGLEDRYAGEPVFSRLLELTAELLLRPRTQGGVFVPQIVMQERQKLLDTIESTLDDKAEYCQTKLLRQMCRGEAYAVSARRGRWPPWMRLRSGHTIRRCWRRPARSCFISAASPHRRSPRCCGRC